MLTEKIRKIGFDIVDTLTNGNVLKNKKEIDYLFHNPDKVKSFQNEKFQALAKWAVENTAFYSQVKQKSEYSLSDFPIIDKNIIKEHHDAFCSELAARKDCISMHTSGSTGTPLVVIQDKKKRKRVYAEMMYLWGLSGYEIGMRYMFLRRWNATNRKSKLTAFARNLLMTDVSGLDDDSLEVIRQQLLHDKKIRMVMGYASTLDALAEYLDKKNAKPDDFNVVTILSGSEVLTEKTRSILKKVFGCNVVSLYSNQENGMLAVECNENKEFHLNTSSYIFEFLKIDSNEPAEYGELARVVVTDLFNYAMPIIRYDTGDLAVRKRRPECSITTEVIEALAGRRVDVVYDVNGKALSPFTITNGMWLFDKLKQFQIIQKGAKDYLFRVNDPDKAYSDDELIKTGREFFGTEANVMVERVNDVPVLASGKFMFLKCEWNPLGSEKR